MAVFMISSGSRRLHSRALPQSGFQGSNYIAQQRESLVASDGNDCLLPQERVVLVYDPFLPFLWGLGCEWAICQGICPHREDVQIISFSRLWILLEILCLLPALLTISETYPRTVPRLTALNVTMRPGSVAIVGVSVCLSVCLLRVMSSSSALMLITLCIELCPCGPCCSECVYGHPRQHLWGLRTARASQDNSRSSILDFPCNKVPA